MLLLMSRSSVAQVVIPDTIPGKGILVGQLNYAKHIVDFPLWNLSFKHI